MAEVFEKPAFVTESGDAGLPKRTYHFGVKQCVTASAARLLVESYFGPTISTPFGVLFAGTPQVNQVAYNLWDVDLEYTSRVIQAGQWTWDFDGTGTTQHITHSLETIACYPDGTPPSSGSAKGPNYQNAIGWNNGEIVGADVIVPATKLTITATYPAGTFTLAFAKALGDYAGYMNSVAWLVWQACEVRFLGPRVQDGSQTQSQAVLQFEVSRNVTGLTVGAVTGIAKAGWDIAWTKTKQATAVADSITWPVTVPEFVYIERVCRTVNFATLLGIS